MIKQSYCAALLFLHILFGIVLLVLTGALWNNKSSLVKSTKRWWLARITRLLGIQVRVTGSVPEPKKGRGILYVSNHVSWVDIPLIGGIAQLNFLSKAEVKNWPLIGKLAEGTGTLFIQRGTGDANKIAKNMADYIEQGRSVLFFPEGTTSDGQQVRRFHPKLFRAVEHTPVDLCPIAIHYYVADQHHNPVAFIDDDEFTEHLWNILKYRNIIANVEFLAVRSVPADNVDRFVKSVHRDVSHSVLNHQAKHTPNTSILSPDASSHVDPKGEAASF
jgi:1-acyl-sn-glycerol-3-phosphate acyltransferase